MVSGWRLTRRAAILACLAIFLSAGSVIIGKKLGAGVIEVVELPVVQGPPEYGPDCKDQNDAEWHQ